MRSPIPRGRVIIVTAFALLTGLGVAPPIARAALPVIVGSFNDIAVTPAANQRSDILNGIDHDLSTPTFVTAPFTTGSATIHFDLGGPKDIIGFRWLKVNSDTDGGGNPVDPMDLVFRATTTSIATSLTSRTYVNVTGLTNGINGTELLHFDTSGTGGGINSATATAVRENGGGVNNGLTQAQAFYSVTFDMIVGATGISLQFQPNDLGVTGFTHYNGFEFQPLLAPEPTGLALLAGMALPMIAHRRRSRGHGLHRQSR